ncbi:homeobox-leucine zipper protein hox32 [Phtheirospermum japonicum]|uniref:Homeobox-leucine zipper protein hox32 n=1 Tax=Phtheirospermum japonicum TaxID=374723 RepID=A0A830BBS0_9LAMI|nr:homeobox-leucine zipper protein hox32 [Phtheirospermum japonicum]
MGADKGKKQKVGDPEEEKNGTEHIDGDLVLSIERLQEIEDELEKVQWIWKREAPQTTKVNIKLFSKRVIVEQIAEDLKLTGDGVYEEFTNSCFGFLMRFDTQGSCCCTALHFLFTHEVIKADAGPDELWYRVGGRFIRFSKYEYAFVTGLSFGPTTFDPSAEHHPPVSGLYLRYYRGQMLTMDALRSDFTDEVFRESPADALKIWAFEAIPELGNACGVLTSDDVLPRCLRWRWRYSQHWSPVQRSRDSHIEKISMMTSERVTLTRCYCSMPTKPMKFNKKRERTCILTTRASLRDEIPRGSARGLIQKKLPALVQQELPSVIHMALKEFFSHRIRQSLNFYFKIGVLGMNGDYGIAWNETTNVVKTTTYKIKSRTWSMIMVTCISGSRFLLTIAEETLTQFLGKAAGTTVDWVQMIGMKGIATRACILVSLEPTKVAKIYKDRMSWYRDCRCLDVASIIPTGNSVALIGPTDANKAKTTHPGRLVTF